MERTTNTVKVSSRHPSSLLQPPAEGEQTVEGSSGDQRRSTGPVASPEDSRHARYFHRIWRATLQPASILTLEEAIDALPCPGSEARTWLQADVRPVGLLGGVAVYRWGDVLEAVARESPLTQRPATQAEPVNEASPSPWLSTAEAAARLGIARCTLDEMIARAPRTLPGAPTPIGSGHARRHWRWEVRNLEAWLSAYRAWSASLPAKTEPPIPEARSPVKGRPPRKSRAAPTGRHRSLLAEVAREPDARKRSVA